jgi:murein DD-endopeptidase MepM/ murein hydrolase activator NlpD
VGKDLAALKALKQNLAETKSELENKKNKLVALKTTLENTKANLEDQQQTKVYLLRQTRNSERRYRNLVAQLKAEQNRINNEIVSLEKTIRAKLNKGGANKLKQLGDVNFAWPVPSHVITTYFHDPDYPFRYIFEHPAIDIRAAQGTPLRAAASGYVAKVRDGGYGYSYIMLIHNNGFSTVYGHVSKIYVKPDEFVTQGEIIGLTGGMPGTPGAGRLTTGPHLHFEVRKNGIPVNPLDYLP